MNAEDIQLAQAAASLTVEDLEYLQEHYMIPAPDTHVTDTHEAASQETSPYQSAKRKRRHLKREWPETGTILEADYQGTHYEAEVIPAPQYRSGKAIKILTGNAAGQVCHSLSGAMLVATEHQRQQQDLGRKGLANGWSFWKAREGGAYECSKT